MVKWILFGTALALPAFFGGLAATIFAAILIGVTLALHDRRDGKPALRRAINTRMAVILGLVCLATLLGFCGDVSWIFDVLSSFRAQYAALALSLGIYFAVYQMKGMVAICAIALAANMWFVAPLYTGNHGTSQTDKIKVMLINVNVATGSPVKVERQVRDENPDLLVLEEASDRWLDALKATREKYPYQIFKTRDDSFGIAVFSKSPFSGNIVTLGRADLPTIAGEWQTRLGTIFVIATHPLPPRTAEYAFLRDEALKKLPDIVPKTGTVIVVGDLNTAPFGGKFEEIIKATSLLDSSRGWGFQPTWELFAGLVKLPIDHLLHSTNLCVTDRRSGKNINSDHCPLIVELSRTSAPAE